MWPVINSILSLVEITAFILKSKSCKGFFWKINFPPMRALEFITGHVTYNLAYTKILQTIATLVTRTTTIPIFQFSMDFTTKLDPANFKKIVAQSGIQSRNKFMSSVILNVVLLTSFHIKLDRLFSLVTKGWVNWLKKAVILASSNYKFLYQNKGLCINTYVNKIYFYT